MAGIMKTVTYMTYFTESYLSPSLSVPLPFFFATPGVSPIVLCIVPCP